MDQTHIVNGIPEAGVENFEQEKRQPNGINSGSGGGVHQSMSMTSISCKPEYRKQISRVNLIDEPEPRSLVVKIKKSLSCSMAVRLIVAMGILAVAFLILVGMYVAATNKPLQSPEESNGSTGLPPPVSPPCTVKAIPRPLPAIPSALNYKLSHIHKTIEAAFLMSPAKAVSMNLYYRGARWGHLNLGHVDFNDKSSKPPTENTIWPIASITKVLTALMMQLLHDEGKITTLDDPVTKYIKNFKIKSPSNEEVTLRQLCCMMSGLPREAPCRPSTKVNYCPYTTEQMRGNMSKIYTLLGPDVTPSYSNLGFAVLGDVLSEIVKPDTFQNWMTNHILKPLKMDTAGFRPRSKLNEIPLTTSSKNEHLEVMDWGWLDPAAGMYASAKDLAKLGSALLEVSESNIFRNTTIRRSLKSVYTYPNNSWFQGCPYEIFKNGPYRVLTKSGAAMGYSTMIAIIPELKLNANIMVANGGDETAATNMLKHYVITFANDLANYLTNSSDSYRLPRNAQALVGLYKLRTFWPSVTHPVNVSIHNGKLLIVIQWFRAYLQEEGDSWTLSTVYKNELYTNACNYFLEGNGLYFMLYEFDKPGHSSQKSGGFIVRGITAFGYARFERIR